MRRSFYQFVLSFRGGAREDSSTVFAEYMFEDLSFPKDETDFDALSRYIEDKADSNMQSVVFDELYKLYEERFS